MTVNQVRTNTLNVEKLPLINDGGMYRPWRIEHMLAPRPGMEWFRVWPREVPEAILNDPILWNQPNMPNDMRPRHIGIRSIITEGGVDYMFREWWGFPASMTNLTRICAGYYNRVPFDQWGVKVEWA